MTPSRPELADQVPHLAGALRIQAVGRLVQDEQVARLQQRGGDAQPLPHAERVVAVPLARRGGQPDPLQRGRRSAAARCAGRRVRSAASSRRRLARPDR